MITLREHMVCPYYKSNKSDNCHCADHTGIAKYLLREKVAITWLTIPNPGRIMIYTSGWPKPK